MDLGGSRAHARDSSGLLVALANSVNREIRSSETTLPPHPSPPWATAAPKLKVVQQVGGSISICCSLLFMARGAS